MKKTSFSIAGVGFDFISHGPAAEYLFAELDSLLMGFLVSKNKPTDAVCLVHFDHEQTYKQRFDSKPLLIRREDSRLNEAIFTRMERIPFSHDNYSQAIGFLNGCLIFDERNSRGLIYIFYSKPASHFMGTLMKLLFIFTCLVMVNRGRLMVHGAGIKKRKGRGGYLFLGNSGAGKSTVASLSGNDVVLSDDATVIEVAGDACNIHATPFSQVGIDRGPQKRLYLKQEKLAKVLFLHQSAEIAIEPREQRNAFTELLTQHLHCFAIMGEPLKRQAFHLCHRVCETTPAFDLYSRKDPGFWELVMAP